ncbi:MAG: glycosyltransferase family 2 protein [Bacteroidetes bacterium]|jgi:glycosyltransferase involved in cell wall biosynthesis|nr:glycosyltransferase family 2 protein [Bacteroidota bacterium]MDF2452263.1 glycosyltransferase family 2 protein [Bacteroidota bacterium]
MIMTNAAVVSIIIPCYNYAQFLPETLDCVINQTFENWECIVVDDGSKDNSSEVVKQYRARDNRIKYVYQENQGLSASRNTGIRHSVGFYIQLLDADDLIEKGKLEKHVEFLKNNKSVKLVYGPIKHFTKENNRKGIYTRREIPEVSGGYTSVLPYLVEDNIFLVSAPLFHKSIVQEIGEFDIALRSLEDWDFWFRFILSDAVFQYLKADETATLIRSHDVNMSSNHRRMWEAKRTVRHKLKGYLDEKILQQHGNHELLKKIRKTNDFFIFKDKGLFDLRFKNILSGFYYTARASFISLKPWKETYDGLYWLKDRIKYALK